MLRHGERTLEVTRLFDNGDLQLEDTLTRRPRTLKQSDVVKRIWQKEYIVVSGTAAVTVTSRGNDLPANAGTSAGASHIVDFAALPDSWRQEIDLRLTFIKAIRAAGVTRGNRERITAIVAATATRLGLQRPSSSTVMAWARRYESTDCNPLALLSLRKVRSHKKLLPDLVESTIQGVLRREYFTRSRHSLRHAHDCVKKELRQLVGNGQLSLEAAKVSYSTLQRRTRDVDAYHRIASRDGDARARLVCRTTIEGSVAAYPLQRVEIDHTMLDWVVICDRTGLPLGRPTLTIAIDAYSNYVVGIYLSFYGPGVTSVSGALRSAMEIKDEVVAGFKLRNPWLSHGLADEWVVDNGLEFHSKSFKAMSWALGVDITYCRVRTPWLKPHVERFFADLKWLTLGRGRVHKSRANVQVPDPYKNASISFADLVKGLTMFIVDVHPFQINERKLERPFDLFKEGLERCPPATFPGSLDHLRLITGMTKQLRVSQGGVTLMGLPYSGPELLALRKLRGTAFKAQCRWDPNVLSMLYVQDPLEPSSWVPAHCLWSDYADGLSWNQHQVIRAHKRKHLSDRDAQEVLWQARMQLHEHWASACRPGRREDSLLAARIAGVTSSQVLRGNRAHPPTPEPRFVETSVPAEEVIPDFDAFEMEGI